MRVDIQGQQFQGYLLQVQNLEESLCKYINGIIEKFTIDEKFVVFSECDAVVLGMPLNRALYDKTDTLGTIFSGNIIVVKQNVNKWESICESDIPIICQYLKPIVKIANGIVETTDESLLPIWNQKNDK